MGEVMNALEIYVRLVDLTSCKLAGQGGNNCFKCEINDD